MAPPAPGRRCRANRRVVRGAGSAGIARAMGTFHPPKAAAGADNPRADPSSPRGRAREVFAVARAVGKHLEPIFASRDVPDKVGLTIIHRAVTRRRARWIGYQIIQPPDAHMRKTLASLQLLIEDLQQPRIIRLEPRPSAHRPAKVL